MGDSCGTFRPLNGNRDFSLGMTRPDYFAAAIEAT